MNKGRLYYVIGPSGSGKDSVLRHARQHLLTEPVVFTHRYITRAVELAGENHICLTDAEFRARLEHGLFALHWYSHGLYYGIGIEIDTWMNTGMHVVVNGSRAFLPVAAKRYPDLVPVLISADEAKLRDRLKKRQRESSREVSARLARAGEFAHVDHPDMVRIDNSCSLEEAGAAFLALF